MEAKKQAKNKEQKTTITEDLVDIQVGMLVLSAKMKALEKFLDEKNKNND